MRLYYFLLLPLILMIFFSSCRKNPYGPRTITVQAVDKTTDEGIARAQMSLTKQEPGFFTGGGEVVIDQKYADNRGMAEFTFDFEKGYMYSIRAIKEPGYYRESYGTGIEARENPPLISVPLQPEGYIRFHLKNVNPVGPLDKVGIPYLATIKGENVDTVICCKTTFGNSEVTIKYWVEKQHDDIKAFFIDQFIPAHDTTLVTIEY